MTNKQIIQMFDAKFGVESENPSHFDRDNDQKWEFLESILLPENVKSYFLERGFRVWLELLLEDNRYSVNHCAELLNTHPLYDESVNVWGVTERCWSAFFITKKRLKNGSGWGCRLVYDVYGEDGKEADLYSVYAVKKLQKKLEETYDVVAKLDAVMKKITAEETAAIIEAAKMFSWENHPMLSLDFGYYNKNDGCANNLYLPENRERLVALWTHYKKEEAGS